MNLYSGMTGWFYMVYDYDKGDIDSKGMDNHNGKTGEVFLQQWLLAINQKWSWF